MANSRRTATLFTDKPENYKDKLRTEFDIAIPDGINRKEIYENLLKERELFFFIRLCYAADLSDCGLALVKNCWLPCVLSHDSMELFRSSVIQMLPELDQAELSHLKEKVVKDFYHLLHNPADLINVQIKMELMKTLCRINAHHAIRLICKLHPENIDLSDLLREAISCLHIDTVTALIDLGADIHQPMRHSNYSDYGYQLFGSALYYALLLPQEPYSALGAFGGPCLIWDNTRLTNMLTFLIEKGADPEQKCIVTRAKEYDLATAEHRSEIDENCVVAAKSILEKSRDKNCVFTQSYLDLLETLSKWTCSNKKDLYFIKRL